MVGRRASKRRKHIRESERERPIQRIQIERLPGQKSRTQEGMLTMSFGLALGLCVYVSTRLLHAGAISTRLLALWVIAVASTHA